VTVASAQLRSEWRYALRKRGGEVEKSAPLQVEPLGEARNPFVENALRVVAAVAAHEIARACEASASGLVVALLADNDFYSQISALRAAGLGLDCAAELPPRRVDANAHTPRDRPAQPVGDAYRASLPKTGLGSSAALTASLVGALLHHFGAVNLARCCRASVALAASTDIKLCHNAAQLAHLAAQGKVGSGFDVAAACWGSIRYCRFPRAAVAKVLSAMVERSEGRDAGAVATLTADGDRERERGARWAAPPCVVTAAHADWGASLAAFALPKPLLLLLGDVEGGSSTPSMVRVVMQWLDASPDSSESAAEPPPRALWAELVASNAAAERALNALRAAMASDDGSGASAAALVAACGTTTSAEWGAAAAAAAAGGTLLLDARRAFVRSRGLLRRMGERAGVPIEPPAQQALCDATAALPGVVAAGVPGAGGFDAIYALVVGERAAVTVRAAWAERGVSALAAADERSLSSGLQLVCGPEQDAVVQRALGVDLKGSPI
jgi:phosphomevalonate kinase